MFQNTSVLTPTFDSYQHYISDNFETEYDSLFLFFMKNYFFNDNYSFKTPLRTFTDLHKYSITDAKSKEIYLDNFNFYAQAIFSSNEDYHIAKDFLKQQQIAKSFNAF